MLCIAGLGLSWMLVGCAFICRFDFVCVLLHRGLVLGCLGEDGGMLPGRAIHLSDWNTQNR